MDTDEFRPKERNLLINWIRLKTIFAGFKRKHVKKREC